MRGRAARLAAALLLAAAGSARPAAGAAAAAAATAATAASAAPDSLASFARSVRGRAFIVAAFDSATSSWGIACAAPELAIGARAAGADPAAGAYASLGAGIPRLAAAALALERGTSPESVLVSIVAADSDPEARLTLVVTHDGRVMGHAGSRLAAHSGTLARHHLVLGGMGLHGPATLAAMADAFGTREGELASRLLDALEAGERAEGDPFAARGAADASASLLVVRGGAPSPEDARTTDLRVDRDSDPIGSLRRLYARHAETLLPASHVRFEDAARRRGDEAAAAREHAAAEMGFRAAVARAPRDADALNELAWFLATRGGDASEAERLAETAVTVRGDDPNLYDTLAEAAYRAGDLERAIQAAERAARLSRGNERYEERLRAFRAARAALTPGR